MKPTIRRNGSSIAPVLVTGLVTVLALLAGVGCSSGGGGGAKSFDRFVKDEIADTAETTQPTEINGRKFRFDEDPSAFDELFE